MRGDRQAYATQCFSAGKGDLKAALPFVFYLYQPRKHRRQLFSRVSVGAGHAPTDFKSFVSSG